MRGYDLSAFGSAVMPLEHGRTALSLGIQTMGGVLTVLIPRDTVVPCHCTETFTTADDSQTQIKVTVYQGHSGRVADNQLVGGYEVVLPNPGLRGTANVEITFALDRHGAFRLTARDTATSEDLQIRTIRKGEHRRRRTVRRTRLPISHRILTMPLIAHGLARQQGNLGLHGLVVVAATRLQCHLDTFGGELFR